MIAKVVEYTYSCSEKVSNKMKAISTKISIVNKIWFFVSVLLMFDSIMFQIL